MNKLIGALLIGVTIMSCGKENEYSTNFGTAAVVNASPGTPTFHVFDDTVRKTSSALAYGGSSGYLSFPPDQMRKFRLVNSANLTTNFATRDVTFPYGKPATMFAYDTLGSGGTIRMVSLMDDLSVPAAGSAKVRFIHLAVNAPAVDVTLLRTSATPMDSVTITNRAYIGASPSEAAVTQAQTFATIPSGTYSIRVKLAGTQTLARTPQSIAIASTGIYSLFAQGTAQGQALAAGAFRNF
jgi:hypothetical protein